MTEQGFLIAFEGGEGSGKTTQAQLLLDSLNRNAPQAILIHEPGSTPLGNHLRAYLKENHPIHPLAELLLFAAARAQLTHTVITPALKAGTHVIADRFKASTIAYQGYARQLPLSTVQYINDTATSLLDPDLTLWLDIPPQDGMRRADQDSHTLAYERRPTARRFENMPLGFHQLVHQGYAEQSSHPGWHRLDATLPKHELADQIYILFNDALRARNS